MSMVTCRVRPTPRGPLSDMAPHWAPPPPAPPAATPPPSTCNASRPDQRNLNRPCSSVVTAPTTSPRRSTNVATAPFQWRPGLRCGHASRHARAPAREHHVMAHRHLCHRHQRCRRLMRPRRTDHQITTPTRRVQPIVPPESQLPVQLPSGQIRRRQRGPHQRTVPAFGDPAGNPRPGRPV